MRTTDFTPNYMCSLNEKNYLKVCGRGAHIYSWVCDGEEQLFVSERAESSENTAIRGGIPVIFPQFATFGDVCRHGFARICLWTLESNTPGEIVFSLRNNECSHAFWPYQFKAWLTARMTSSGVSISLRIENTSNATFSFTAALHSYFLLSNIDSTYLRGLSQDLYWNNGSPFNERHIENENVLRFHSAIDRIYFQTNSALMLASEHRHSLRIESEGFTDTVVWNPWQEGAKNLKDMNEHEYKQMLCVEAACAEDPVLISPGQAWTGTQHITRA